MLASQKLSTPSLANSTQLPNHERLQALLTYTRDLVLRLNLAEICCDVSPSIVTILGLKRAEVIGESIATLVHPDDLAALRSALQRVARQPSLAAIPVKCRLKTQATLSTKPVRGQGLGTNPTSPAAGQVVGQVTGQALGQVAGQAPGQMTIETDWRLCEVMVTAVVVNDEMAEILLICHDISERQRAESLLATLERTESEYRSIFENVSDGIYRIAPDGRYLSANPKLAAIFGYSSPEELIASGQPTKAQHYTNPRRWLEFICLLDSQGVIEGWESQVRRRDGSTIWVAENVRAAFDRYGNLQCYEGTLTDITQRKQAEEALQRANEGLEQRVRQRTAALLEANDKLKVEILQRERAQAALKLGNQALNACSNGIVIADARLPKSPIVYVNPAFERMTGYSIDEAVGQTYDLLLGEATDQHDWAALSQAISAHREHRTTLRTYRQDGSWFWCELSMSPMYDDDGRVVHLVGIYNDVTDRRQLAEDLQKALESERELNELKSRFITTTSHEFRTPLTVIGAAAEYLEHYGFNASEAKRQKQLDRIRKAVRNMTQLLEDVLYMSKAEANRLEFAPQALDLVQFCSDLIDELRVCDPRERLIELSLVEELDFFGSPDPLATAATVDTAGQPGPTEDNRLDQFKELRPQLDPKLLRYILANLISNAIKYSPDGSPITIFLAQAVGDVVIAVRDRGIGIPASDLPRLFESFHRADNVGTIQGTGLGLAIVKNAVDLHGGTITVNSREGKGTQFTVRLPLARSGAMIIDRT